MGRTESHQRREQPAYGRPRGAGWRGLRGAATNDGFAFVRAPLPPRQPAPREGAIRRQEGACGPQGGPAGRAEARGQKSKGQKELAYGAHLAGRKPTMGERPPGSKLIRCADRQNRASSYQVPPRKTRPAPEAGPTGSVTVPE